MSGGFRRPARRGTSALEVVGAVLLIGLSLAPALGLFPSGAKQAGLTTSHVQARAAVDGALDEWIAAAIASGPAQESGRMWQLPSLHGDPFELTLTASPVEGKPGLWSVEVKAEWTFPAGKRHSLEAGRLFCEPGLAIKADSKLSAAQAGESGRQAS